MDLFLATFESVAILLGIGIIGFWIIRKKVLPVTVLQSLSPLALEIALPSLVFVNILQDFSPQSYPFWWQLPLWWLFFTAIIALCTFVFTFISKKSKRREFAISLFYQNGIFFPLAILTGMFQDSETYIVSLFLFTLLYPGFFFSTYHLFFRNEAKNKFSIPLNKIFHPAFIATLLAIGLVLIGVSSYVPHFILSILSLLGAMTVPLLMIILGGNVFVDSQNHSSIYFSEILKFILVKNFIFPFIFLGFILTLKPYLTYTIALLLLLESAVPPLTAIPIVTGRLNGDRSFVSQLLVGSFITSVISIPLMIFIFSTLF